MSNKKSSGRKTSKPEKVNRELRRQRTLNIIFLIFCAIMILSLIISAVAKY